MNTPVRYALVGGGPGSFIGGVHRMAAGLEGRFTLVAGAFSRDRSLSAERGSSWGVDPNRVHTDHRELFAAEAARPDGIEAVAIATPNDSHFALVSDALAAGLHVICDKPMTATLEQALALASLVRASRKVFALTYTYAGYAMIRDARARVQTGEIGRVRKVVVEYPQGWLSQSGDAETRQASWRTDPARAGIGGCLGDIGVHAFQLVEYVSGLRAETLCADLARVVSGRRLDDDCNVLMRLVGNVPCVITASQIATGERNGLSLRVYGDHASLVWRHDAPGELRILHSDASERIIYAGSAAMTPGAAATCRLPSGHPEGFIEAFATLYRDFADAIRGDHARVNSDLPGISDGLRSLVFAATAIASHDARCWMPLKENE